MNLCVFFPLINLSSFSRHNKRRCRRMNLIFKRFFISLLLSDNVVKNSIFHACFLPRLSLSPRFVGKLASVLIVPQVFMMYYGGFYCIQQRMHLCRNFLNGVESRRGVFSRLDEIYDFYPCEKMDFFEAESGKREFNMSGRWKLDFNLI